MLIILSCLDQVCVDILIQLIVLIGGRYTLDCRQRELEANKLVQICQLFDLLLESYLSLPLFYLFLFFSVSFSSSFFQSSFFRTQEHPLYLHSRNISSSSIYALTGECEGDFLFVLNYKNFHLYILLDKRLDNT